MQRPKQHAAMPVALIRKKSIKFRAMKLVREMPGNASWDELMYRIHVMQKNEAGLAGIKAGKTHTHEAVCREFGVDA
jgi:hypothetical protein